MKSDVVIGFVTTDAPSGVDKLAWKIEDGMQSYFAQYSWTLIQANSGRRPQPNGEAGNVTVIQVPRFGVHHVTYPWHGIPAKTNGYRAIMEFCHRSGAQVCLILDPAQGSFSSDWIDLLIRPGLHSKYDLVTPLYNGCVRERLLSANLLSPLLRTLFGPAPSQPMAGEFLLSARLIDRLLSRHDWDSTAARYTPELWISCIAAAERYRAAESCVGTPAQRRQGHPHVAGHQAIEQIYCSFMSMIEQYEQRAMKPLTASPDLDRFGLPTPVSRESAGKDGAEYLDRFLEAHHSLGSQWRAVLDPRTFAEIEAFAAALRRGDRDRCLPSAVWVRTVYELAAAWKRRRLPRRQIAGLFPALYLARAGSFLRRTRFCEQSDIDSGLKRLGEYYSALHPVLCRLWTGAKDGSALSEMPPVEAA